ncbi:MAG: HEPN domain-containing protein [Methanosarcinales archaeon]|uniref:HEPN domain-containing protein n=1 Tax=Candidatus Ethanoperedens thermophilum TaxID=2766897 RepID=A0A848D3F4_9EURY|nr:HEPN domain-containing protein [Candidatus Ethanoperedens thermophilum]
MDEVNFCLEEAEKRIEASKILLNEGFFKDAVSRTYYSMYYASKALLSMKGIQTKTHRGLRLKIGELVIKGVIEREYGKDLTKAEDKREIADYGMYKEFSMEEVRALIEDAERFLERIKRAIKEG